MTQTRSLIILGLAILLGLAAVFIANSYLTGVEKKQAVVQEGMVKVAVARVPLEYGMPVTADKIRFVDWPRSSIPEGTFNNANQLTSLGKARVALRPVAVNEPILKSRLSGEGGRASISAVLRPEMRATAVRVSDVSAVGGFVLPGDSVDVLITRTEGENSGQITDVLLQNVRVIAIDLDANDNTSNPKVGKTATLEVSQVDAQKLALAQQIGSLSLVLRNVADQDNPVVATVATDDLRDGAYVGAYSGPRAGYASAGYTAGSVTPRWRPARRRAPSVPKTAKVEIVRGLTGSSYEVKRHAGF
ncbi:Flp pilus assembly protein CpaB [Rhizorhapis sp. SPR117]|uniref:Flp pilus assembly protein CpaB n=1 Tax=Rhizorhapis sp. SPR117 TaxID=2912611 RepID=UPI001F3DB99C|nr:Flp pilus assembly protein CpaB [Rhizorhapis sp. SPR117]